MLDENYLDTLFSSFSSLLLSLGAPLPVVSIIAEEENTPYRILISTVISLRTKDSVTEASSKRLFSKAPKIEDLLSLNEEEISSLISPCGFYKRKAHQIKEIAKIVKEEYDGKIPKRKEELLSLPGVGVKTANLVLNLAYGKEEEVCVDCHVHEITNRLGWVKTKKAEETEKVLKDILPLRFRIPLNELFVRYGQFVCLPVSPKCTLCPLFDSCPKIGVKKYR